MELKQYQYVLKVAELQNMTKAAEALYIAQPALSHYIAKVEEELGIALFNRNTKPISLTLAGEKYVETARMILELDGRLKQEAMDIARGKAGVLTVGISNARASFFLPYVLPEFRRLYEGVQVRTMEARSDLVEEYVAKGQCDMGILPFPLSGRYALEQEVICKEELLLVSGKPLKAREDKGRFFCGPASDPADRAFSAGEEKRDRPYVNLSELGDFPFSLLRKGHGIRTAVDVLFMEYGIKPRQIFETTSNETAYRLSTVGMGLAIVPESTIWLSHSLGGHYIYALCPGGFFWEIGAAYRKKEYLNKVQRDWIRLLQKTFSGQVI